MIERDPGGNELADLFSQNGWRVDREPQVGPYKADLLVRKGPSKYLVEVKKVSEGRSDRVIPLLSQAILQAQAGAQKMNASPLAIVEVDRASRSLLRQIDEFSKHFASGIAIGLVSREGARWFVGDGLEGMNADAPAPMRLHHNAAAPVSNIFSDLNQWMLKVLLAPRIPENLLHAPRAQYRNASELAAASDVSVMSAFRFVQQLQGEGFLEARSHLKLVRCEELLQRWKSVAFRPSPELNASFLIRGALPALVRKVVHKHDACLGYHAAAEALRLGHVVGAAPYIYVRKLPSSDADRWKELAPAPPGQSFDVILKQARSPQSIFRAAVNVDGVAASDIIQIWLDVSAHPSRGQEQADHIWRKVLYRMLE